MIKKSFTVIVLSQQTLAHTLLELLFVLSILSISLSLALPGVHALWVESRAVTAMRTLQLALDQARTEAILRDVPVALCPGNSTSSHSWHDGYFIQTDSRSKAIIHLFPAIFPKASLHWQGFRSQDCLYFLPTGTTQNQNGRFIYEEKQTHYELVVSKSGRARIHFAYR